jgi:mono/diheme cytochrome c family protein
MKSYKLLFIFLTTILLFSFTTIQDEWVVPTKYETMKNPTDPAVDWQFGKIMYNQHCKSCHGAEGYGDGTKSDGLEGDLGDFSTEKFQKQTDGSLFYKTKVGRDDMPGFSKKLSDEDRWLIVNYMRTLKE